MVFWRRRLTLQEEVRTRKMGRLGVARPILAPWDNSTIAERSDAKGGVSQLRLGRSEAKFCCFTKDSF